jgi:hypothetical protein
MDVRPYRWAPAIAAYSTFAPERSTTSFHFAVSLAITPAKSCALSAIMVTPWAVSTSRTPGSCSAFTISALSQSTISLGVQCAKRRGQKEASSDHPLIASQKITGRPSRESQTRVYNDGENDRGEPQRGLLGLPLGKLLVAPATPFIKRPTRRISTIC